MAQVVTIVDGISYLLDDIANVAGLTWSTAWPGGCLEASWQMDLKPNTFPRALTAGGYVEVWDGPIRAWSGYLSEPVPGETWTLHAKGWSTMFARLLALTADESAPSAVPNVAIPAAITRAGLPITVGSSLSAVSITEADETVSLNSVAALLDAYAAQEGKRWRVDADNVLWVEDDPTSAHYTHDSPDPLRGTADDDYVTDVYPRFVSSVDGGGEPDGWGLGHVSTASQPAGRRERAMDVRDRGIMLEADAEALAQPQLDLNGARMGYTNGLEVVYGELVRPGGSPARLGLVRGGEMFTSFNVADASGQVQLGMTADVVIGRTTYVDGSRTLRVDPVGLAPRTFVDTLAALKVPETFDGSAA